MGHGGPFGNQVFSDMWSEDLDTSIQIRHNLFEKHVGLLKETETKKGGFLGYARGVHASLQ